MTAQSLAERAFYNFRPYFSYKLRLLRPQFIMSCILALLSYPLVGVLLYPLCSAEIRVQQVRSSDTSGMLLEQASRSVDAIESMFISAAVIGVLCLVGLFVFTFVTTLRSFRYLYDKTYVDMDMSLPVNHNTRFFGDLAAVSCSCLLPHLAAILIGIAALYTCGLDGVLGSVTENLCTLIVQCMFTGLYSCIMQIGLCLLMLSFCGRKAEAYIYPILVNIALPIIHYLAQDLSMSGIQGAVSSAGFTDNITQMFSISATSPLGMLFITLTSGCSSDLNDTADMPMFSAGFFVPALLITLVFFAGAYFLIKYRRNERVGMSYVYRGMDLIIPGVLILALSLPFCSSICRRLRGDQDDYYYSYTPSVLSCVIWLVVLTLIAYIVMALISGRNFKRFHITLIRWAETLVICAAISAVLAFSHGFGAGYYVPAANDVATVSVRISGDSRLHEVSMYNVSSSDAALINAVTEIHRDATRNYLNESQSNYVSIGYTMKSGENLERSYYVTDEKLDEYLKITSQPELWYIQETESLTIHADGDTDRVSVNGFWTTPAYDFDGLINVSGMTLNDLLDAIRQDSLNVNYEMLCQHSNDMIYNVQAQLSNSDTADTDSARLEVYGWMENTLALLKEYGIDPVGDSVVNHFKTAFIIADDCGYGFQEFFAIKDGMSVEESSEYDLSSEYYSRFGCAEYGNEALMELIDVSTNNAHGFYCRYFIFLSSATTLEEYLKCDDDILLYVPEEYSDKAEQLLQSCELYRNENPDNGQQGFRSVNFNR